MPSHAEWSLCRHFRAWEKIRQAPQEYSFRPGQSGNPLGRPKRKVDMSVALNKALNDNILVTNLGRNGIGGRRSVDC